MAPRIGLATNIGLCYGNPETDDEISDSHTKSRANVSDCCTKIENKWGRPSFIALTETGGNDFNIAPWFGEALASAEHVTFGDRGRGRRGVCTWDDDPEALAMDPPDTKHEIVTTITPYRGKNGRKKRIAMINCYRNQHKDYNRTVTETVAAIKHIMYKLRKDHKVQEFAAFGDFNTEEAIVLGSNMTEIKNSKLFHKHNSAARATFIDRIFTNSLDFKLIDVLPTLENKSNAIEEELGHKVMVFSLGQEKAKINKRVIKKKVVMKQLKNNLKDFKPKFKTHSQWTNIEDVPDEAVITNDDIDKMCTTFFKCIQKPIDDATIEVKAKERSPAHALWCELENAEEAMLYGKKQEKQFIKVVSNLKNGLKDGGTSRPSLDDLRSKLEKKLEKLNPTDIQLGKSIIDDTFKNVQIAKDGRKMPIRVFRNLMGKMSNSGAKDYQGQSLLLAKCCVQKNMFILRRLKLIFDLALRNGYFPQPWKVDLIIFLYKNKGLRTDAGNWRPITLAPAIGKMFEKYIMHLMTGFKDMNHENHAYTPARSCITAITEVNNGLLKAKLKGRKLMKKKVISILSADDISGAFESVDHELIRYVIGKVYKENQFQKLALTILSYLNREAYATDDSGEKLLIRKTILEKSTPQGSLMSPLFWRVYDGIFTERYRRSWKNVIEECPEIIDIFHVSYADDHLTVITLALDNDLTDEEVAESMSSAFDLMRDLIMEATVRLGCGVNPQKSESIVPKQFKKHILLEKKTEKDPDDTFKWLGFFLTIDDNCELSFNEQKIKDRIAQIEFFRDLAYQYTKSIGIRWRIWKVFIAPFVELYTPLIVQKKEHNITCVHKLQHHTLCRVAGVPITTSRIKLEEKVGERSVFCKATRLADRTINALKLKEPIFEDVAVRELRTIDWKCRTISSSATKKQDRDNFITKLFSCQKRIHDFPIQPAKFNAKSVKAFAVTVKAAIQKHAIRNLVHEN